MFWVHVLAVLAAGILAISGLILSKKPNAKEIFDKVIPFQGFLGVGLLVLGILDLVSNLKLFLEVLKVAPLHGIVAIAFVVSEVLLGFLFGMPLIAQWIPGDGPAEQRAMAMQKRLGGFSTVIGIVGIVTAVLFIMWFI
ncbi:MAG TPA: hypothetical protein VIV58_22685 [Kofleriaceae bacterium]